jgi:acylphosphatase
MADERRTILFSGRVQGVGFRATCVDFARGRALSGTVRNLDDGRVELVVQGPGPDIETLLRRLAEHFGTFIRTVDQTPAAPLPNARPGVHITH